MKCLWLIMLAAFIGGRAQAQETNVLNCFDCVLGIWDDVGMTRNSGVMEAGVAKDIYLGIRFGQGYNALAGLEFSIAGMRFDEDGFVLLSVEELIPIAARLGSFQAPADTSRTSTETGGISMAWSSPVVGSQALIKLTLLRIDPVADHLLRIKRRYPTSNPAYHTAIFNIPDPPNYTAVRLSGGCYVLNWSGDPNIGCDVITTVDESTWTGVKQLFH